MAAKPVSISHLSGVVATEKLLEHKQENKSDETRAVRNAETASVSTLATSGLH